MPVDVEVIDLLSDSSCCSVEVISISSSSSAAKNDGESSKRDAPLSSGRPKRKRSSSPQKKKPNRPTQIYYDNVEKASRSHHVYRERKRPPEIVTAIHKARAMSSNDMRNESEFIGDWWDVTSRFSQGEKKDSHVPPSKPPQCPTFVPASVMITSEDEITVSSSVTLEPALSDSEVEIISMSSSAECNTCERHSLHLGQIERLLENVKAIPTYREEETFIIEFIAKIEALLCAIEADADSGISIFYHQCSCSGQFNPSFTITKLIQVFDGLCQICMIATKSEVRWKHVIKQLFNKSRVCGVILRILYLTTYELIVSRGNVRHDVDHDHVIAVSFGLQMIATMMRNIYFDSRLELQETIYSSLFLDRPLECHKVCIKRNCRVDHRGVTACQFCGLRFHKSCFACEVDVFDKCCPGCKASASLVKACTESNLSDIYSLVVEKGASPLQAVSWSNTSSETALHASLRCNNYNLMSMLLFGAYLILNCDGSLRKWNFPSIAWGRDSSKLTPFEKGIDICLKDMNAKPPTEILLLLTNRGVDKGLEDIRQALEKRRKMIQVMNSMTECDLLHSDASMGVESLPVRVSESVSLKINFFYVSRSVESRETAIRWFDCRSGRKKCLYSFQGNCTKEKLKKLHRDQSLPPSWRAFCNYLCPSNSCSCQIEGLRFGLEIFETNGRGLGLRTARGVMIKKGDIICNYEGEIVSASEAKRRDEEYSKAGEMSSYTINLDEKGDVCIDATAVRSASAFINHSCAESNTYLFRALGHHLDEQFPSLVFRAKRDIGELEELTFNYVKGMPDGQKPTGKCSECSREHCLCKQCTEIAHKKHSIMV